LNYSELYIQTPATRIHDTVRNPGSYRPAADGRDVEAPVMVQGRITYTWSQMSDPEKKAYGRTNVKIEKKKCYSDVGRNFQNCICIR
jgi:hypothetical protein